MAKGLLQDSTSQGHVCSCPLVDVVGHCEDVNGAPCCCMAGLMLGTSTREAEVVVCTHVKYVAILLGSVTLECS